MLIINAYYTSSVQSSVLIKIPCNLFPDYNTSPTTFNLINFLSVMESHPDFISTFFFKFLLKLKKKNSSSLLLAFDFIPLFSRPIYVVVSTSYIHKRIKQQTSLKFSSPLYTSSIKKKSAQSVSPLVIALLSYYYSTESLN